MPTYRVLNPGLDYATNANAVRRRERGEEVTIDELEMKHAERGDVIDDLLPGAAKWLLEDGEIERVTEGSRHRDLPPVEPEPAPEPARPAPSIVETPLRQPPRTRMEAAGVYPAIEPGIEPGAQPAEEGDETT